MALNIKDEETDRLARELAALSGQPLTTAIREALRAQLEVLRRKGKLRRGSELESIISRGRERATFDERAEEEILGYDDEGLPA